LNNAEGRREPPTPESLERAEADLGEIRDLLVAAGRGGASATELQAALQRYLRAHSPALQEAAYALGEEVRVQLLEELYRWRAQLESQLGARPGEQAAQPPETGSAGTG
jgi:hypothetical protein